MPSEAETQAAVTELVKLLLLAKGMRKRELAELLGSEQSNITHTMSTKPRRRWSAHDVRLMCLRFEVPAEVFWGDAREAREALVLELELELLERL